MKHKVLKQNSKKEGSQVVVTKTIEQKLTKEDIHNLKQHYNFQKENLLKQLIGIQEQIDAMKDEEERLDGYLEMLEVNQQPK